MFPTVYRDHIEVVRTGQAKEIECDQVAATAEAIRLGIVFPWKEVATLQLFIYRIGLSYVHISFRSGQSSIDLRVNHEFGSVIRPILILLEFLSESPTIGKAAEEEVGRVSLRRTFSNLVSFNDQYTGERTLFFSARNSTWSTSYSKARTVSA